MTKNGKFCAILALLFGFTSLAAAAAGSDPQRWLGVWFVLISVLTLIGAAMCTFAAIADYLSENEE